MGTRSAHQNWRSLQIHSYVIEFLLLLITTPTIAFVPSFICIELLIILPPFASNWDLPSLIGIPLPSFSIHSYNVSFGIVSVSLGLFLRFVVGWFSKTHQLKLQVTIHLTLPPLHPNHMELAAPLFESGMWVFYYPQVFLFRLTLCYVSKSSSTLKAQKGMEKGKAWS